MALATEDRLLSGTDANQAVNLVHVYDDRLVHSVVPVNSTGPEVTGFSASFVAQIEAMTPEERLEAFSSKTSTFNQS
jgi:hypothetical protein